MTDAKSLVPPEVRENMKDVKHKIVVLSGKGGVGKTTVATNLAISFARKGLKSGILDVDICGPNVPKLLGLEDIHPQAETERISPIMGPLNLKVMSMGFLLMQTDDAIAWRGPLVGKAIRQFLSDVIWGELEVLVVDLPPGTGDEILSILQSIPDIDGVVIVSTPQEVAVLDARRAIRLVERMGVPILGIIENMSEFVCPKCGETYKLFGEGVTQKAAEDFGVHHLGSLPLDPRIISLSDRGIPFVVEDPESMSAKAFGSIVNQINEMIRLQE